MATERRECSSLHFDFQFSVIVAIGGKGLDAESITKTLLKDKTYHLAAQLEWIIRTLPTYKNTKKTIQELTQNQNII